VPVVNLDTLADRFDAGTVVTLVAARAASRAPSAKHIKVLGPGEISKAHGPACTSSAPTRRRRSRPPAVRLNYSKVQRQQTAK
jgi:ribosomal protein L15